uniref:AAA+ ATPase domain-containing protein n=1 Tax=viral metagenome TaxID=1070528 RepID=A0A6C0DHU3_9ZZZZ
MSINDPISSNFVKDTQLIQKYKYYFAKDNYNHVMDDLLNNKVSKIFIDNKYNQLISVDNLPSDDSIYNHYHLTDINEALVPNLIQKTSEMHVPIYFVNFIPENIISIQKLASEFLTLTSYALPIFFFLSFLSSLYRANTFQNMNMNTKIPGNNKTPPFGFPSFQQKDKSEFIKPNVSLKSWAGSPEVIEECKEVISYIEKKELYKEVGADMPKGILLEGPPGTGKTLLAKAIATETNSTFISMSGSEFVELFVGMGAARVRELFETARNSRPSIIFIDEIDAVARQRGAGINMANDEREQTLNQLLYEMDGFNNNDDIVVMAATNRRDVLDQAILRPGRFDRIIRVPLPDKFSREKILDYYIKNKKTDKEFDIKAIAELTDGFSGAQLKNLINEAAILVARNNGTVIEEKYVFEAFEKLIVGLIRNNADVLETTQKRVAIHESGHALLSLIFSNYFDFQKASIQPTYNGAGGYTIFTEKPEVKEGGLYTKDIFKKRLIITLGGKAAESLFYGDEHVSLGAVEDLRQANKLAQRMIGNFGMGTKLEVFFNENVGDDSNPFLGRSLGIAGDKYSQYTKYIMDKESLELVNEAYKEAKYLLKVYYDKLIEFSELLKEKKILANNELTSEFRTFI